MRALLQLLLNSECLGHLPISIGLSSIDSKVVFLKYILYAMASGQLSGPQLAAVAAAPEAHEKPRRRLLRRPERREQILAAATRAFAQAGFAATSLDDVAVEAGISRDNLYR